MKQREFLRFYPDFVEKAFEPDFSINGSGKTMNKEFAVVHPCQQSMNPYHCW